MRGTRSLKKNRIFNFALGFIGAVVFLVLSFCPKPVQAEESGVFFSEIMFCGSSASTSDKWIELYNSSDEIVDLSNWTIRDSLKTDPDSIYGKAIATVEKGKIAPKGYFLIAHNSEDHIFPTSGVESVLSVKPDVVASSLSFSKNLNLSLVGPGETGEQEDSVKIDSTKLPDHCPTTLDSIYYSLERTVSVLDGSIGWQPAISTKNLDLSALDKNIGNPENSGFPPYEFSSEIKFKEFLPHPKYIDFNTDGKIDSNDEYIKLTNLGTEDILLDSWFIVDASGKKFFLDGIKILAGETLMIFKSKSGISQNDTGDTVYLYDGAGSLMDQAEIPDSSKKPDTTVILINDTWHFSDYSAAPAEPIAAEVVKVEGEVVEPERTNFWIESDGKRKNIFLSSGESDFQVGQQAEITGAESRDYILADIGNVVVKSQVPPAETVSVSFTKTTIITTVFRSRSNLSGLSALDKIPIVNNSDNSESAAFISGENLLSFIGVLIFFEVIIIYEICGSK